MGDRYPRIPGTSAAEIPNAPGGDLCNFLMWARENRIAVHRLSIEGFEIECTDLALAEPHRTAAQDDTIPTDDGYPDTIEGRIARDMNLPPPPSARKDEDDD